MFPNKNEDCVVSAMGSTQSNLKAEQNDMIYDLDILFKAPRNTLWHHSSLCQSIDDKTILCFQ